MSAGLRELLELPESTQAASSEQVEKLREQFLQRMGELNRSLQLVAGQATDEEFQALDTQRLKLYEAFQKTSSLIDKGDPSTGKESVQRMLAALEAIQTKAAEAASGAAAGREEWLSREDDFDNLVVRIGELEDAGNSKAATLRKLADSIRARANDCDYQQSVSALDQLQPKFDQIYLQHQLAADSPPQSSSLPGGTSPDTVAAPRSGNLAEQLQSQLKETDSLIAELEEAQVPKAPIFRKAFVAIRELGQQKAYTEAAKGYNRLRPQVDKEYGKLNRGRSHGVLLPEEYAPTEAKYSTGLDIPPSTKKSKAPPYPAETPPTPGPAPQYQSGVEPKQAQYKPQPSSPSMSKSSSHGVLKKGSRGPDVSQLQQLLGVSPDGDFGPKTEAAVKALQKSKGIAVDGVVGPQTWSALGSSAQPQPCPPQPPQQGAYPPQPPKQGTYPAPPPAQKPAYPTQPPKTGPSYPPEPPKQYPKKYPAQPPDQYEGQSPAQPPAEYTDDYPSQPTDEAAGQSPAQPWNEHEPLVMEEAGDKSQGDRIQMPGMSEDQGTGVPTFGLEPGVFRNETKREPPPPRDDPVVGPNKPVDPNDKFAGVKGTFDEILGVFGLSGVFSDVPHGGGDPAEYNPDSPTKSGPTKYGHLRPKDGPLESDPPPAPPAPTNTDPPPPPAPRTWGVPQPGDPDFIGPPAPPPVEQMVEAPAEVIEAIEDATERLFGGE